MDLRSHISGKLSVEHIQQILALLPFLEQARPELAELINEKPERATKFLKPDIAWSVLYEMPIELHLACFSEVAGLNDFLINAASSSDPHGEMMKLDTHPDYQEWEGGTDKKYEIHHLLGVLYSLLGTIESLMLYGFYINELLAQVAENNDDDALFKAIRVDPIVITTDIAAHRIACASITANAKFFDELQKALKGKTGGQARYLKKFKVLMQILLESGQLNLPTSVIVNLAMELDTYSSNPNAEKNLNELIRKFRKMKTISN
ncbi:hypothetical protein D3C72_151390 [compost metagenome]